MNESSQSERQRQAEGTESHRQRLLEIYKPQTTREAIIIADMAKIYQEMDEFEADHKRWMQFECAHAPHAFKRQEADDFLKLKRQWPKAPAAIAPLIGDSIHGALWLVELWQIIVARLAPRAVGPVPGMDQACQALLAMGFSDKIQHLSEAGWWWATRFLAIQSDKDEAIKAWLRKSGTCDRATELQQARHKLYDAPDANIARKELYDEALRQADYWSTKLSQLQAAEPAKRQAQTAQARCMGLKVPGLATCLNNAFKLRDSFHKLIKFTEERFTKARKDFHSDVRYDIRMKNLEKQMPDLFPPQPDPELQLAPTRPAKFDLGQAVEDSIHADLLPKMVATSQPIPESTKTYAAHQPQPAHRPMSNRKKRLAKMAAREELARQAAMATA